MQDLRDDISAELADKGLCGCTWVVGARRRKEALLGVPRAPALVLIGWRGPGMIMDFCYQGYMLSGDKRWIQRAANGLRVHKGRDLKLSFQAGIFLEGMRKYYEMSGDEEALAYIKDSVDRLIDTGKIHRPRTCGACAIHISRY